MLRTHPFDSKSALSARDAAPARWTQACSIAASAPILARAASSLQLFCTEPSSGTKPDRQALKDELIDTAKQLGSIPGFSLLMLDTENKFVSTGLAKDIADAAQGRYFKLPKTNEAAIAELTQGAVGAMKA